MLKFQIFWLEFGLADDNGRAALDDVERAEKTGHYFDIEGRTQ
jgi:hypothetical protein